MNKAVFLDRDGVINEMVYHEDHGIIDSPFTPSQFHLIDKVTKAIGIMHNAGFKVVVVSNQPGIAKKHFNEKAFEEIQQTMRHALEQDGVFLDGEYYCFHHPDAKRDDLRINCECRKPKPGLLLRAAEDLNIYLARSWMIGDGITDIQAGTQAGCHNILIGRMKCELCEHIIQSNVKLDAIEPNLLQATEFILGKETNN